MAQETRQVISFAVDGGVSTEAGPSFTGPPDAGNMLRLPWLIEAQNVIYNLDGWPQKMPGVANVHTTATGATDTVIGLFDYWRAGTSGAPTQQRVLYSGTSFYSQTGTANPVSILGGFEADRMPWFEVANDLLVIASTSTVDVPQRYNQTTMAALGGSPPNFNFHAWHRNRMWAAGVDSVKSRVFFSALDAPEDWTGAGSGSIDVSPDDGDVVTGLRSYKEELWVFKGPYRGSIHRIKGSAPTGTDAFSQHVFVRGVGATNNQAIITSFDDLWFWDDFGIHSMVATDAFAGFKEAFLSRDISSYFQNNLAHNRFEFVWGVNFAAAGIALWTVSRSGIATNDLVIGLDYRFRPPRFFFWPVYAAASLAIVKDTSNETIPWIGTYVGFLARTNRAARNYRSASYTALVRFPYVSITDAFYDKSVTKGRVGYSPKGDTTFTVGLQRDGNTQQTFSVSQAGGATLAPSSDQFTLDVSALGGGRHLNQFFDPEGQFKEIQVELSQGTIDVDFEPHSFALEIEPAGFGAVATLG